MIIPTEAGAVNPFPGELPGIRGGLPAGKGGQAPIPKTKERVE